MGMFDHVKYTCRCPNCGTAVSAWQTKASPCFGDTLQPWEVGNFYGDCPECKCWIEITVDAEVEHVVKRCDLKMTWKAPNG